uniref:Fic/DOC family protein n=1 Tax=Candidatus Kentrum sp. DK TaxID=2126562 RepID=A0A450T2T7_9GAMM|nr:MAG: Fic/DOC family protein [Candidatus Kentron sp. DK]
MNPNKGVEFVVFYVCCCGAGTPRLMMAFEEKELARFTPCNHMDEPALIQALARVHGEIVLIHPFREGNGRGARLLACLMAL